MNRFGIITHNIQKNKNRHARIEIAVKLMDTNKPVAVFQRIVSSINRQVKPSVLWNTRGIFTNLLSNKYVKTVLDE